MNTLRWAALLGVLASTSLSAGDPSPTQPAGAVNPPYHGAAINSPFPDNYYGADHGGSSLTLSYPFASPFGNADHSRGVIAYYCAPFTPRNSEGVYGMDVWLEVSVNGGGWNVAGANNGLADGAGSAYQPVNTPNPGPSPAYHFQWTFDSTPLPPQATFRVFIYVYLYNQGGGSQGNFYVASTAGAVSSGAANDPPAIAWDASYGAVNPTSVTAGQTYAISATGTDDNGNLTAVQIFRNGQPFAAADGGDGWSSDASGSGSDSSGVIAYSAQATDSGGLTSPLITATVSIMALQSQPAVASLDGSLNLGSAFTPTDLGGAGSGGWQFAIGGYTNFDAGATDDTGTNLPGTGWIPSWTASAAGSYSFWISHNGDDTYAPSAIAGPYTLTVIDPNSSSSAPPPAPDPVVSTAPPVVIPTPPTSPSTSSSSSTPTSSPSSSTSSSSPSSSSSSTSNGSSSTGSTPPTNTTTLPPGILAPIYPYGYPPPASPTPPPAEIARIRFNSNGHDAAVSSKSNLGSSILWTDPAGLATSAWPSFNPAPAAAVSTGSFALPAPSK